MSERAKHVSAIINKLSDTCQQRKKEKKQPIVVAVLILQRHFLLEVFF